MLMASAFAVLPSWSAVLPQACRQQRVRGSDASVALYTGSTLFGGNRNKISCAPVLLSSKAKAVRLEGPPQAGRNSRSRGFVIRSGEAFVRKPVKVANPAAGSNKPQTQRSRSQEDEVGGTGKEGRTEHGGTKLCIECGHLKQLVDFENRRGNAGLRKDICRACLTQARAKKNGRELHHLAMSVAESWEKAKVCSKCQLRKELRDFARNPAKRDGVQLICRACTYEYDSRRGRCTPSDAPKQCPECGVLKPATDFAASWRTPDGRGRVCKICNAARTREMYLQRKAMAGVLRVDSKVCSSCCIRYPASGFYLVDSATDGLSSNCRKCSTTAVRKRQLQRQLQRAAKRERERQAALSGGLAEEAAEAGTLE